MLKTFAEDLKYTREENNITLRDVSNKTRLNISILESLESGDYSFQPQAYIRAFLKQYITAIGLDPEEILFDYDLARSGKYKSKRQNTSTVRESSQVETIEEKQSEKKFSVTEKIREIVVPPHKPAEEIPVPEAEPENNESNISPHAIENEEKELIESKEDKPRNKFSIDANKSVQNKTVNPIVSNNSDTFSFLRAPVFRYILIFIIIALILAGIYSLISIIFLEGSKSKPEVIRQNFDDVVNEQERKILGKRTPEEIQDSIRKAEELLAAPLDSITLKINSVSPGTIFIVTDSTNYNKPEKIEFSANQVGEFKAGKSFHVSSANTESFEAFINNKAVKFDSKTVSKVKLDKNGIVK